MGINISIVAGPDQGSSRAEASGSLQHIISDVERNTFNLSDDQLKRAIEASFGKRPNDAYLHSHDLYKTYGWQQVQTILEVHSAEIVGVTSKPTIVTRQEFPNHSNVPVENTAIIREQVTNTSTSAWSKSQTVSVGQKISYKIAFFKAAELTGETSFEYSHEWGEEHTESKAIMVGSESGAKIKVPPGKSVIVRLSASKGVMKVRVRYKAYLTGDIAVNYNPAFKDHHYFGLDIAEVMAAGNIQNSVEIVEDIEIGYYSDSKIVTENGEPNPEETNPDEPNEEETGEEETNPEEPNEEETSEEETNEVETEEEEEEATEEEATELFR